MAESKSNGTGEAMGYFSNGTEGDCYERDYCARCVHEDEEKGCAVMLAHVIYNYEDCDKEDSILHMLIPRAGGFNEQCRMFHPRHQAPDACQCGYRAESPDTHPHSIGCPNMVRHSATPRL